MRADAGAGCGTAAQVCHGRCGSPRGSGRRGLLPFDPVRGWMGMGWCTLRGSVGSGWSRLDAPRCDGHGGSSRPCWEGGGGIWRRNLCRASGDAAAAGAPDGGGDPPSGAEPATSTCGEGRPLPSRGASGHPPGGSMNLMSQVPQGRTVTLADIADMADVGRSAVSNWRKRHEDFPAPVGSSPRGPLFDLSQVEDWLRARDQLRHRLDPDRHIWRSIERYSGNASAEVWISALGALLVLRELGGGVEESILAEVDLREAAREAEAAHPDLRGCLVEPLAALGARELEQLQRLMPLGTRTADAMEAWAELLRMRGSSSGKRTWAHSSSTALNQLLTLMADPPSGVVYDPAAGEGGLLLAAWEAAKREGRNVLLVGQEISAGARVIAMQRAWLAGAPMRVHSGDTLTDDFEPQLRAALVLCDPPYSSPRNPLPLPWDDRWGFGIPPAKQMNFAWLQHCYAHLAPGARAFVLLPTGSLFRSGLEGEIRSEMVRQGAVEAVMALPAGLAEQTTIPLALWILHRNGNRSDVLLVDGSRLGRRYRGRTEFDLREIAILAAAYRGWRDGSLADDASVPAAAVSRSDLVGPGATLVPSRWASLRADRTPYWSLLRDTHGPERAWERLQGHGPPAYPIEARQPRAHLATVGQLIEEGQLQRHAGLFVDIGDLGVEGTPVVTQEEVRAGYAQGQLCAEDAAVPPSAITRPGDLLVLSTGEDIKALVDEHGGQLVKSPLQVLRITGEGLNPWILSAVLSSSHNRDMARSTGIHRLDIRTLTVPRMTAEEQTILGEAVKSAALRARAARALADAERSVIKALGDTAITHTLEVLESGAVGPEAAR